MKKGTMTLRELWRKVGWQRLALAIGFISVAALAISMILSQYAGRLEHKQEAVAPEAFEEETGIRVKLLAVTAGGGLVDFRFKVLDPLKAQQMVQDPKNAPVLVVEHNGTRFEPLGQITETEAFVADRIYFTLSPNTGGALQPGDSVTLVIGDWRLEHMIAQ
jgi:hypothetical protein